MAQYEPKQVDLTIVLDDTLCKGAESWAWYGLQPVHKALKAGHTLIVISLEDAPVLLKNIHRREQPYKLSVLRGVASFSGMWVYKDDHTDVRVLGAIAKALPQLMRFESVEKIHQRKAEELSESSPPPKPPSIASQASRSKPAWAVPQSCISFEPAGAPGRHAVRRLGKRLTPRAAHMPIRLPKEARRIPSSSR